MKKIILGIFCLAMPGCAYLEPMVQDFNVVSVAEEIQLGEQTAGEVRKQMQISPDPALNAKVTALGERLVQALPRRDFAYRFYVVNDKSPNAFTIPGGSIYVHTGLLEFAKSEVEVAGVMAHEIGHAYLRHPAKSISRQYGVQTLSQILFKGNAAAQGQVKKVAVQIAQNSILSRYGREDEFEADEVGFYILRRSGQSVSGLLSFFGRLQQLQGSGNAMTAFLSTHPPTPERISRLKALEAGQAGSQTRASTGF